MKKLFIALGLFLTIGLTSCVGVNNDLPIQARAVAPQDESSEVVSSESSSEVVESVESEPTEQTETEWVKKEYAVVINGREEKLRLVSENKCVLSSGENGSTDHKYILVNDILVLDNGKAFKLNDEAKTATLYVEEIKKQPSIIATDFYAILNTPVVIAGVSIGTIGTLILIIIKMTSFGRKNIKRQNASIEKNEALFDSKGRLLDEKISRYEEIIEKQTETINTLYKCVLVLMENSRNVKVQEVLNQIKGGGDNGKQE